MAARASAVRCGLLALVATAVAARAVVRRSLYRRTAAGLRPFTPTLELDAFPEAGPRLYAGSNRAHHAVLLLHGYSASPHELGELLQELERYGIPYYAPLLTGHGLTAVRLLYRVEAADWLRDALNAYDQLAAWADEVSVVGHSTGATLAAYVAEHRRVKHLILIGPNLIPLPADRRYKALLQTRGISMLVEWMLPVFPKPIRPGRATWSDTLDPEAARRGFSYAALPIHSLRAHWALQDHVDIARARAATLTIVHGAHDITVDVGALLKVLVEKQIHHQRLTFAHAAHNVLEDYDKRAAAQAILDILRSTVPPQTNATS